MALTLIVRSGSDSAPAITLDQPKVLLGRSTSADLVLPDPSVSHQHASIRQRGSEYIVLDEGSSNGTHVGPVRLSEGTPRVLKSGDLLRLGRVWVEVKLEPALPSANQKALTKEIALALVGGGLLAEGEPAYPKLRVKGPGGGELDLVHFNRPYVVGRSKRCDLALEDDDCSRRHVEVVRRGLGIWVRDLGSKNGSTLDGQPLDETGAAWNPGSLVRIGKTEMELDDPVTRTLREIEASEDEVVVDEVDGPVPAPAAAPSPAVSQKRGDVVEVPRKQRPQSAPPPPRHSAVVDVSILLLAALVIALSAVGLWWLL